MKKWSDIPGWFNYGDLYEEAANRLPVGGLCVEVGSWQGCSACYLASRLKELGKDATVFCVDQWSGLEMPDPSVSHCISVPFLKKFMDNVRECGLSDVIVPIISDSDKAASRFENASLDFIFIDASHDYASVKRDISVWLPKLKPGGTISGHDFHTDGVKKAVFEAFSGRNDYAKGWSWLIKDWKPLDKEAGCTT